MTEYTDPPGMPDDERMTAAEFRVVREFLGLTGDWLAAYLDVTDRTVRHWEQGKYPIPDGVRLQIEELEQTTADHVGAIVDGLAGRTEPAVHTFRADDDLYGHHPETGFPSSWHRAVIARVAQEVNALSIRFAEPVPAPPRAYVRLEPVRSGMGEPGRRSATPLGVSGLTGGGANPGPVKRKPVATAVRPSAVPPATLPIVD